MLDSILPDKIFSAIKKLNYANLQEIRLRVNKPVTVCYYSNFYFLGASGIVSSKNNAIYVTVTDIADIVHKASNYSIYAINDNLKQGYITLDTGERIGIIGQVVSENGNVITVKNFSSLNIRIPHEIKGVSNDLMDYLVDNGEFLNTLIVSSPAIGKTTLIRDIVRNLCSTQFAKNVLVVDERNEISASFNGESTMDLGDFSDIITFSSKEFAFTNGIRSMSPEIIATDEIGTKSDYEAILKASSCGVKILATIHAKDIDELLRKTEFTVLKNYKIFKRYVVLKLIGGKRVIDKVYDENFDEL